MKKNYSKKELDLIVNDLLQQYCTIFAYKFSTFIKDKVKKKIKSILKLVSKKGIEIFEQNIKEKVSINLINELVWNHL